MPTGVVVLLVNLALLASCAPAGDLGTRVWSKRCAACHGQDGRGRTKFGASRPRANLLAGPWKIPPDPVSIRRLLLDGTPDSPMPPFAGKLSDEEVDAVVKRLLQLVAHGRNP